jgi:hypothetical protein
MFSVLKLYRDVECRKNVKYTELVKYNNINFKKFPEFAGVIYRNSCMRKINVLSQPFVAFGLRSERNAPEIWRADGFFLHNNAPAHRLVLVKDFLAKKQCENTRESPVTGSSWFLTIPYKEMSVERTALLWYYWHYGECDGGNEKAFTKWLPGMFSTPLQSLGEVYRCAVSYLSEIKWFWKYLKATTRITSQTVFYCNTKQIICRE